MQISNKQPTLRTIPLGRRSYVSPWSGLRPPITFPLPAYAPLSVSGCMSLQRLRHCHLDLLQCRVGCARLRLLRAALELPDKKYGHAQHRSEQAAAERKANREAGARILGCRRVAGGGLYASARWRRWRSPRARDTASATRARVGERTLVAACRAYLTVGRCRQLLRDRATEGVIIKPPASENGHHSGW
jgi:hypothetical protein